MRACLRALWPVLLILPRLLCAGPLPPASAVALPAPVAAAATPVPPEPLRLGVIGPFSGPSSDFGTPMLRGVQLAVDEINAVGGFLGRPIELLVRDDQATPALGALVNRVNHSDRALRWSFGIGDLMRNLVRRCRRTSGGRGRCG